MGIELDDDQLWAFLADGHEGVLTTLRSDGWPVSLPVWYVVKERAIFLRTGPRTKKIIRIQRDSRSSFLVTSGERWAELKAVAVKCRACAIDPGLLRSEVLELFDNKYRSFRTAKSEMPTSSQKHYKDEPVVIQLDIVGAVLSWDNSRLRGLSSSKP